MIAGAETVYVLAPEVDVRAALRDRPLSLRVLAPPYAALGVGRLRVMRVREGARGTELLCGYDRYERLGAR